MVYNTPLPSSRHLKQLADWGGPYPIDNRHLILLAVRFGFGEKVMNFLQLFPLDATFQTRRDFMHQCDVIRQFLRANQEIPMEFIEQMHFQTDVTSNIRPNTLGRS
jgi:hypothetical protein